jgi:hypothetical protein
MLRKLWIDFRVELLLQWRYHSQDKFVFLLQCGFIVLLVAAITSVAMSQGVGNVDSILRSTACSVPRS